MTRFGVFVDAGYLFAAAGKQLFGTRDRTRLEPRIDKIQAGLLALASTRCGLPTTACLRTYWYDGARDLVPTPAQVRVAAQPGLKLRLGNLTQYGQKGVDSRIVRDLIILATERAISEAFLLGGDEDLREGVAEAQERGVRVTLIGVGEPAEASLSHRMIAESDDVVYLGRNQFQHWLEQIERPITPFVEPGEDAEAVGPPSPDDVARRFIDLLRSEDPAALQGLVRSESHSIPQLLDRRFLLFARTVLAVEMIDPDYRRLMRDAFWDALELD